MTIEGHLQRMHKTPPMHHHVPDLHPESASHDFAPVAAPALPIVHLQSLVGNRAVTRLIAQRRVDARTGTLMRQDAEDEQPAELPPLTPLQPVEFSYTPDVPPEVDYGRVVTLRGQTTADFDHSNNSVTVAQTPLRRGTGCEGCSDTDPCVTVNTTGTFTYQVPISVSLPDLSTMDLNECERQQAQNWIDTVLSPHEQQHVQKFSTYNGTTTHPVSITACNSQAQAALDARTQEMLRTEQASRQASAQTLSDALDPFNFDFEINCPEPPQSTGTGSTEGGESD